MYFVLRRNHDKYTVFIPNYKLDERTQNGCSILLTLATLRRRSPRGSKGSGRVGPRPGAGKIFKVSFVTILRKEGKSREWQRGPPPARPFDHLQEEPNIRWTLRGRQETSTRIFREGSYLPALHFLQPVSTIRCGYLHQADSYARWILVQDDMLEIMRYL